MANQVDYRDPTPNNFPQDYDQNKVDSRVKLRSDSIKHKQNGIDTREAMYQALEIGSVTASEANAKADKTAASQDSLNERVNDQIIAGTIKDEEIDFRRSDMLKKTFDTMRLRGDFFDKSIQSLGVNIEWFGAVGDGITDNNNAIQTAIQVAKSTGVNRVYIPEGTFYTTGVNYLVKNMQIVGAGAWASILATDKADPIFNLNNNSLIENIGIKQTSEIESIALGVKSTEAPASYWNVRIRHVHIFGPEVPSTGKGNWKLTGIKFDLNGKGLWDVTLDDISIEWVYDGVIADTYNQGWFTGSLYNNVTVKGFANCAFGNISSNNTMRQVSQNSYTNLTAEILYETPKAIGFIVSGTGNEYNNLRLFGDGAWSGNAIQLKHFGDNTTDIKAPSFGKASCANNSFIGGNIEGVIDDPDKLRELQHFDNLKLQVADENNVVQQVIINDEPHPNLLGSLTLSNMLDARCQQNRGDKTSELKSGSDEYGKYIQITAGSKGDNWWYYFTEPDGTAGALRGHDHTLGIRFRAMTDGSTITNGRVRFNEIEYPRTNKLYYFSNPSANRELKDFVWIYSSNENYFTTLHQDSIYDAALFSVAPNSIVRIYDAFLVSGRVTSFGKVTNINNFNNPESRGGRNLVKNSDFVIGSPAKVINQPLKKNTFEVDVDALNWLIGKNIVLSVDCNLSNYMPTNVTGRLAAYITLVMVFEDNSTKSLSAGMSNTFTKLARDRYSFYYRLPNKRIKTATCSIVTADGFTADYYQLGRPMVESGTIPHDYIIYNSKI